MNNKNNIFNDIDNSDNIDNIDNIEIIDIVDISNNITKKNFLRKGQGRLASHNNCLCKFNLNRKSSFIFNQEQNEKKHIENNIKINNFMEEFKNK